MTDKTMDNPRDEKEKSRVLKVVSNIGFTLFMLIMIFLIFITAQSRLTGQEPSLFGHRMYIVDSGSMVPTLPINSIIVVNESTASEIEQGDIVTYYAGSTNTRVTHRVVEVLENNEGFITRGDANNTEDPNILQKDKIIGKLAFSIPFVGAIFRVLSTKAGIGILVGLVAIITLIPIIVKKFA